MAARLPCIFLTLAFECKATCSKALLCHQALAAPPSTVLCPWSIHTCKCVHRDFCLPQAVKALDPLKTILLDHVSLPSCLSSCLFQNAFDYCRMQTVLFVFVAPFERTSAACQMWLLQPNASLLFRLLYVAMLHPGSSLAVLDLFGWLIRTCIPTELCCT